MESRIPKDLAAIRSYGKYYEEKKLWKTLSKVAKNLGSKLLIPVLQLYYMLESSDMSLKNKAYIIGALGYFILPVDIIPDFIYPVLGFTDDLAVMTIVIRLVEDHLTSEVKEKAKRKARELIR